MADVIRPCTEQDLDDLLEVINDAAQAYKGIIPDDRAPRHAGFAKAFQHYLQRLGVREWKLVMQEGCSQPRMLNLDRSAFLKTMSSPPLG